MRGLIIIVNYRTPDLTIACLESLAPQVGDNWRVVVVDNESQDGSADRIRARLAEGDWAWASVVEAGRNAGFAAGNNVGLRLGLDDESPPDVFFLLNPDTVAPAGALARVERAVTDHPQIGCFGASMVGPDGERMSNAFRFPSIWSELEEGARLGLVSRLLQSRRVAPAPPDHAAEADWMSGAALIVRRAVVEDVGLMDEGYFLYFEEVDWLRRARRAGHRAMYVPSVEIVHLEGSSTGCGARGRDEGARRRRPGWWYDSRRRYFVTHHGWLGLGVADVLWGVGRFTLLLRRALGLGGSIAGDPSHYARDLLIGDLAAAWRAVFARGLQA